MSTQENTQAAKDGYAAFGRGDVPAILAMLTDDVEWINPGPPDTIPGAGIYRGPDEVGKFFGILGSEADFQVFDPHTFIAEGDRVVALIHAESTVRSTGRKVVDDGAHVWTFTDGKVSHFQVYQDTAALVAGYGKA